MEKIIFRGKVIDNSVCEIFEVGEFVYGDLIHYPNGETFIRQIGTGAELPVNPDTVGREAELFDREDTRIFRGDFVDCNDGTSHYIAEVVVDSVNPSLALYYRDTNGLVNIEYDFVKCGNMELKIIGNRYDNPELFKKINNN